MRVKSKDKGEAGLSVTHDVLYSKARYVLNKRHIKRPWFNLNPFLEKTDESIDLENYLPDESKYIQPLESLVLCESYRSEHPVDTREVAVDQFFEYLNSDEWRGGCSVRVLEGQLLEQLLICLYRLEKDGRAVRHTTYALARNKRHTALHQFFEYLNSDEWRGGCSVRVLEGQLLEQLLICLYRLEKDGRAVRHTTYALARNKRQRTGCYKLADKTAYGFIEDTLLIEFAYFGHLTKDAPNPATQNPLEYLRQGVPESTEDSPSSCVTPSTEDLPRRKRTCSISVDARSINSQLPEVNYDPGKARRMSLMAKPLNAIRFVQSMKPKARRMSMATDSSATASGTPMSFLQEERSPSKSRGLDFKAGGSEMMEKLMKKFPVHRFQKTAGSKSSDEQINEKKEKCDAEEELDDDEFYLSDERLKSKKKPKSTEAMLKKKKEELQTRRQEVRAMLASRVLSPAGPVLPPLPPLDMQENEVGHNTIKMPDEMPTFEEFLKILRDDEYYDPRYSNKVRLKRKKIAQRYYMAKGQRRCSALFDADSPGTLLDSKHQNMRLRLLQKSQTSRGSRIGMGLSSLQETSPKLKLPDIRKTASGVIREDFDPANIADEVLGVTDSEPCKDHCLALSSSGEKSPSQHRGNRRKSSTALEHKRSSINAGRSKKDSKTNITNGRAKKDGSRSELPILPTVSKSQDRSSPVHLPPMFPKPLACDDEPEYPDTDSEEESTDDETYLFDAGKLNVKYSIERLRKKQKKKKKKPVFYDILAKYYKMQDAMTAFRKGSMTREVKNAKQRAKRMSLAGFFRGAAAAAAAAADYEPGEKMTIGKLKKFNFLETPTPKLHPLQKLDQLSTVDFAPPCLVNFCSRLEGALEKFVVRREIVVSELPTYYKSATSVTFTKKSCFVNKHKNC